MKITSKELRKTWIEFYKSKGHIDIGAVSLIGDGSTGAMFNVAGMQPLMPYLLGKEHPCGKRLCNVQGCIRTVDIDSVGDESHCTFFEMMGNWSLGDYFKKEKTAWTFELLTTKFNLEKDKIHASVFEGDESAPRDIETAKLLENLGIKKENIHFFPKEDNWWELDGLYDTPCGPDNEWFYPMENGNLVEIGNDVYMQYKKTKEGYVPLSNKNVDTGFGFERCLMFLNNLTDVYKTDLFEKAVKILEARCNTEYGRDESVTRAMRIICDHTRTMVMLIGDEKGILPSNVGAGYILRRVMRRAIRYVKKLDLSCDVLQEIAVSFIENYKEFYPSLEKKRDFILDEIKKETDKFEKALFEGEKEFNKVILGIEKHKEFAKKSGEIVPNIISGKSAFRLYDTFGFPIELTQELAKERGYDVNTEDYQKCFKEHQEKSKIVSGSFKGGLVDDSLTSARLHTATHIMLAGLRKMFGNDVVQKGSNITPERLRFDFNLDHKMTQEEILELEEFVNDVIKKEIPVRFEEVSLEEAKSSGAIGTFDSKYSEKVKVYVIDGVDRQICGGPHAQNTKELHHFKIIKEESSSSGIRRIKAILD